MEQNKNLEQLEENEVYDATNVATTDQTDVEEVKNEKEINTNYASSKIEKFKTTEELAAAYKKLEAEFTKKCQELSSLKNTSTDTSKEELKSQPDNLSKETKDIIIKEYLQEKLKTSPVILSTGGAGFTISSSRVVPKTLNEAGELLRQLLK